MNIAAAASLLGISLSFLQSPVSDRSGFTKAGLYFGSENMSTWVYSVVENIFF